LYVAMSISFVSVMSGNPGVTAFIFIDRYKNMV
jgi:hypothetical protein